MVLGGIRGAIGLNYAEHPPLLWRHHTVAPEAVGASKQRKASRQWVGWSWKRWTGWGGCAGGMSGRVEEGRRGRSAGGMALVAEPSAHQAACGRAARCCPASLTKCHWPQGWWHQLVTPPGEGWGKTARSALRCRAVPRRGGGTRNLISLQAAQQLLASAHVHNAHACVDDLQALCRAQVEGGQDCRVERGQVCKAWKGVGQGRAGGRGWRQAGWWCRGR